MIPVVHHPGYIAATHRVGTGHFSKYALVMEALAATGAPIALHEPDPMSREWIEAVHAAAYVDQVLSVAVPPAIERRIGFAVTEAVAMRSRLSLGGTWLAARLALAHGYAANSAGGSHHAHHDSGAGYCVFNDLAVAANRLIAEGDARRILIVDCDVHQGDGTAELMVGRRDVMTLSIHAEHNFPVRKARSDIDVALPDGTGDADYLAALRDMLDRATAGFAPDLILYQAGVDVHRDDRLGRLALSDDGIVARDRLVADTARRLGIPLASTLGGGYGDDLPAVARRHARSIVTLGTAMGLAAKAA